MSAPKARNLVKRRKREGFRTFKSVIDKSDRKVGGVPTCIIYTLVSVSVSGTIEANECSVGTVCVCESIHANHPMRILLDAVKHRPKYLLSSQCRRACIKTAFYLTHTFFMQKTRTNAEGSRSVHWMPDMQLISYLTRMLIEFCSVIYSTFWLCSCSRRISVLTHQSSFREWEIHFWYTLILCT